MSVPPVSVVMPVHNAAPYLDASVASILGQTFTDFEFVALDDASTDGSREVLRAWAARDRRLRLLTSDRHLGLAGSSDHVARAARAPLVARMDADDVCAPARLERQVRLLDEHPDVVLVATLTECIDAEGRRVRPRDRWRLVRRSPYSPFPHGSICYRREAFDRAGGYRQGSDHWEDLDLYHRLAAQGRVLVLPDAMYQVRFHRAASRPAHREAEVERAVALMLRCMHRFREARSYEDVLAAGGSPATISRLAVLYSVAAPRFWAGHPPALLERLSWRDLWPSTPGTLAIVAFACWGAVHHHSLRTAMRALVRFRDWLAGWRLDPTRPYEWRFR